MKAEMHPIEPEKVMAYLDGELVPDDAAEVAQHLEQCAACAELASELRGVSSRLLAWDVAPASTRLDGAVISALNENGARTEKGAADRNRTAKFTWRNLTHSKWAWAGAGVAALVAIGVVTMPLHKSPVMSELASREAAVRAVDNAMLSESLERDTRGDRAAAPEPPPPPPPSSPAETPATGPMIARTASLNISTADFDAARTAVDRIVRSHQGYVSSLNVSTERSAPRSLDAKLAVPAAQYEATLAELRTLGRVAQEQQSSEEVSSQIVDLDARLRNARETEAQLAEILRQRAGKVGDVLEVEKEMARVRGEIEVMAAEQKQLHDRVAFASIELNLGEEYKAQLGDSPSSVARRMRNALVDGYHTAADGLVNLFIFALTVGPSLLLAGVALFFPARWAWRRWRKSRLTGHGGA
jgi:anti-sigma factor RsiW